MKGSRLLSLFKKSDKPWGQERLYDPDTGCYCFLGTILSKLDVPDEMLALYNGITEVQDSLIMFGLEVIDGVSFIVVGLLEDWNDRGTKEELVEHLKRHRDHPFPVEHLVTAFQLLQEELEKKAKAKPKKK